MAGIVKCSYCGNGVAKEEAQKYKGKNFHADCLIKQKDRDDLSEYICRLFSLKAPGPRIYTQIRKFLETYSYYTYTGIKQALIYFFEVKKNSVEKANQGIGIVPYVYDEAQEYYAKVENRQERVAEEIKKSISSAAPRTIKVARKEEKKVELYDLDNL